MYLNANSFIVYSYLLNGKTRTYLFIYIIDIYYHNVCSYIFKDYKSTIGTHALQKFEKLYSDMYIDNNIIILYKFNSKVTFFNCIANINRHTIPKYKTTSTATFKFIVISKNPLTLFNIFKFLNYCSRI